MEPPQLAMLPTRLTFQTTQVLRFSIPVLQPILYLQIVSMPSAQLRKRTRFTRKARDTRHSFHSQSITRFIATTAAREVRLQPLASAPPVETSKIPTTTLQTSCSSIPTARPRVRAN